MQLFDTFYSISTNSGFNMGIKLFVIDYVYYKFPKVKRKYDSVYKLWKSLPTRQEWEWTHVQSHIDDVSYLISKMPPLLVHTYTYDTCWHCRQNTCIYFCTLSYILTGDQYIQRDKWLIWSLHVWVKVDKTM